VGPSRGRSLRLVPFLFGVAGRGDLPGPVLVRLLGDLGLTGSAARGLIARMQGAGQLAGERRGRTVHYRLAGDFARAFERVRDGAPTHTWPGYFHALLYQVAEADRAFRDKLRRAAQLAGYGHLQQGVLIASTDRRGMLASALAEAPPSAQVYFARLHLDTGAAARAAAHAWDLRGLRATYQSHIRRLTAAGGAATAPHPGGPALRRYSDLLTTALVDTLRAPALPPELLPDDWPLPALRAAIGAVGRRYGPPSAAYIGELLGAF
jgi:phenylacetic acid degradation operon negative regulatory protein